MSGWEPEVVPATRGTPFSREWRTSLCPGLENRHDPKARKKKSKPKAGLSGDDHF